MKRSRWGFACALAVLWALGGALPAAAQAAAPNDFWFAKQWALASSEEHGIDIADAWERADGHGVLVGVVDTPIDATHEDLRRNVVTEDPYPPVGRACSGPPSTHGTHIAGIIAAERDNAKGIAGVAPEAEIVPVPALDACGGGDRASVLAGMRYAAGSRNARVVVGSFATDPLMSPAQRAGLEEDFAALFADYPRTLFVVAAGNEGADLDEEGLPVYPCSTGAAVDGDRPPNLLCVGMTDATDTPGCSSNVGRRSVDLFAPGTEIWSSTVGPNGYGNLTGTSMAAAMVAGAAALVASKDETLTGAEVKRRIVSGGDPFSGLIPGSTEAVSWRKWSVAGRRLNAYTPLTLGENESPVGSDYLGGVWESCDKDHDGFVERGANPQDKCLGTPGPVQGCPDADGDDVRDADDNCAQVPNPGQEDADRDGAGDACDATPRGGDADGDRTFDVDDRCPTTYATTADGCPAVVVVPPNPGPPPVVKPPVVTPPPIVPVVAPRITKLTVKVTHRRCQRGRKCRRAARVSVRVSRTATVTVRVERRVKTRGHWRWRRVLRRSVAATERGARVTVRGKRGRRLAKGAYRVKVTLPGAASASRRFKV